MTNYNLFSEIYGCYFTVVKKIIKEAQSGIKKKEIDELINTCAFDDSAFYLAPKIFSNDWCILDKVDDIFFTKANLSTKTRPLTNLEKAWLKSLILDKRFLLFVSEDELKKFNLALQDIEPLFNSKDFYIFDSASDGDPYDEDNYKKNFQTIFKSCQLKKIVKIDYDSGRKKTLAKTIIPHKLVYSNRDDKFRLLGILVGNNNNYKHITINIGRVISATITETDVPKDINITKHLNKKHNKTPIVISISTERSALERCMLQFASWEKETEYDEDSNSYICKIYYDKNDETELLIRLLSFGPVIKVLGPESFLNQVKERIFRQYSYNKDK